MHNDVEYVNSTPSDMLAGKRIIDLSDEDYRAFWLKFHASINWAERQDMTNVPIDTFLRKPKPIINPVTHMSAPVAGAND